jgi:hypothetical protein
MAEQVHNISHWVFTVSEYLLHGADDDLAPTDLRAWRLSDQGAIDRIRGVQVFDPMESPQQPTTVRARRATRDDYRETAVLDPAVAESCHLFQLGELHLLLFRFSDRS